MKRSKFISATIGIAALIGAATLASQIVRPRCTQLTGADSLRIQLSKLTRGAIGFFCYRDSAGARMRFVLARADDGTLQSVFDACRQCYKFHKGYTVSGSYLICRLCGTRYKISEMRQGKASCVPVALPFKRIGDSVTVKVADLERGASLF